MLFEPSEGSCLSLLGAKGGSMRLFQDRGVGRGRREKGSGYPCHNEGSEVESPHPWVVFQVRQVFQVQQGIWVFFRFNRGVGILSSL
ncbi:hypothetical protein TNCV_4947231 [Trichonephila clavipes]|nr:hypothetical protein TNCV_4947231 [Trichonephila clavipes]